MPRSYYNFHVFGWSACLRLESIQPLALYFEALGKHPIQKCVISNLKLAMGSCDNVKKITSQPSNIINQVNCFLCRPVHLIMISDTLALRKHYCLMFPRTKSTVTDQGTKYKLSVISFRDSAVSADAAGCLIHTCTIMQNTDLWVAFP